MLNYEISGEGQEPVVLLHGFLENNSIWNDLESYLSEHFSLIKIDLPGHGKSEVMSDVHTMELMAEEVKKVTDHLNLSRFHILGHSMGGYVSLAFAEKWHTQLKSLTLFFSTFQADDDAKKELRRKSFRIIQESFSTYVGAGVPLLFNPNEREQLDSKIEQAKKIALSTPTQGALAAVKGMIERTDKRNLLEQIETKVLVLAGRYDAAINHEALLNLLPQRASIKHYLLDCGHNGHWELPKNCAEIINKELIC
ncbi:alpha/beta hydrolase [Riemerella anatipestifer]|uniref:alpha/beta fold hydrolase n=1 Tax=Riemerella anatipestifer TaxID=34085 RepID=UPI001AD6D2DE|nr:alpha/beta hydrolase [Riemerella anatipestifer]MBO4234528.1 alpha/beta hydrolase [Riemerella anatipestifer]MDY3317083.1 alpha/beta hydrolase [Riemerella anatipestifer]